MNKDSPTISIIINITQRTLAIINFLLKVFEEKEDKAGLQIIKTWKYDHFIQRESKYVPSVFINPMRSLVYAVAMSWKLYKRINIFCHWLCCRVWKSYVVKAVADVAFIVQSTSYVVRAYELHRICHSFVPDAGNFDLQMIVFRCVFISVTF